MTIRLRYFQKCDNWGDAINPYLVTRLTNRRVSSYSRLDTEIGVHLLAVGSIIHWATLDSVIWGTGAVVETLGIRCRPRTILAVRGPLTRRMCIQQGVACPEVYGDPALLFPRLYNPPRHIRFALGVIPHYADQDSEFVARCRAEGIKVIDVFAGAERFVDDVRSCASVVSSSLHGLICADAYGIPNKWIDISGGVIGGGFKFRDYYASQGVTDSPAAVSVTTDLEHLRSLCEPKPLRVDLDLLHRSLEQYLRVWP